MGRRKHAAEEMIRKPREAEVLLSQGQAASEACSRLAASEHSYYVCLLKKPICASSDGAQTSMNPRWGC